MRVNLCFLCDDSLAWGIHWITAVGYSLHAVCVLSHYKHKYIQHRKGKPWATAIKKYLPLHIPYTPYRDYNFFDGAHLFGCIDFR